MNLLSVQSNQHFVERWTTWALRSGVWTSAALMILGLILTVVQPAPQQLAGHPSLGEMFSRLFSFSADSSTIASAGLIVLMFTPFLRVLAAFIGFSAEKDWRFSAVSLVVFLMLVGEVVYALR